MKTKEEKRKITVQVWEPVLKKMNAMTSAGCLNRDAYLDVVFANEAAMLVRELEGRKNSGTARTFVKQCLLELKDLHPVSLTLTRETIAAINDACDQVNVWRDVFVNRVIYLLVAKSTAIEQQWDFKFKDHRVAIFKEVADFNDWLLEPRLASIRWFIADDPFLGIRAALRAAYPASKGALHALPLGQPIGETPKQRGLAGFSTYLDDAMVPGTPENKEWASELL